MNISEKKLAPQSRVERLALALNVCIVVISLTLALFMRLHSRATSWLQGYGLFAKLPQAEIADRLTVIILLALCALGFIIFPQIISKFKTDTSITWISICALTLTILTVSWRWGDPTFDQRNADLWYGWGDKFAFLLLIAGLLVTYFASIYLVKIRQTDYSNIFHVINVGAIVILFCYYLPSIIQPFKGIIDTFHSRYILNDLLISASGRMPYSEITPQYVGILGWPLNLLKFLPGEFVVNSALVWINFLVVLEVFLTAYLTKKALEIRYWAIALLIPVASMFVKVQPNMRAWGSLAQHMNLIPGRTVLPLILLFFVSGLSTGIAGRKKQFYCFTTGLFLVLTALNNLEFGMPASIASIIILVFLLRLSLINLKSFAAVFIGAISALVLIVLLYQLNDSQLTIDSWLTMIRAHGVDGFMNLEMPFFGLWIFFYAILGAGAIIGSNHLYRVFKSSEPEPPEMRSAVLLTFGGLWGSATLFYFSGRSLVPEIIVFIIPLTLCIIGFMGMVRTNFDADLKDTVIEPSVRKFKIVLVPLFCLLLIPVVSLTQAPNPAFEWLRMAGTGERWSSRALKSLPKYQEMLQIVEQDNKSVYLYMGNDGPAFEVLSGVENGLGIILLQDLLISDELTKVGCYPALKSNAEFALVPKTDWVNPPSRTPCPGFVLLNIDPDSEFLIYKIPSKVSS